MTTKAKFETKRTGTGTNEWAEETFNIACGCSHNCLYCYAAHNANRFKLRPRADWAREELTKRAEITRYPARDGVIMFPSAHDITPQILPSYIRVARLMLEAGNRLLIVSKPDQFCIERLCQEFRAYRDQILFRFTIGTCCPEISRHWEPGAPLPAERIIALHMAFDLGFRTSVSAEPLLGGIETALSVVASTSRYVTDTIWIGKMNKIRTRVDLSKPANVWHAGQIEAGQIDDSILMIVDALKSNTMIRWKDSINEVISKYREFPK